ncbi:MAG: hypothetical protein HY002_05260 [Candidatus Rokubacteria bacterium]|nr:hypothetical protein [Candidatus Rokubacteria bacterium]
MRSWAIILLLTALVGAACVRPVTKPVRLRHPVTGTIVQCGPYRGFHEYAVAEAMRERGCVEDYQRQGYERVPE